MTEHDFLRLSGQNRIVGSSRRTLLLLGAAILIVGFEVAVFGRIHLSKRPVEVATVYAAYLAAAAIGLTLLSGMWTWWRANRKAASLVGTSDQVTAAAERLADEMSYRWRQEAAARRITTPAPATVRWRWAAVDSSTSRGGVAAQGMQGAVPQPLPGLQEPGELLESGVVSRLHNEVYSRLPYGRLVLLGESGAGKTGAMILLLLAALSHRASLPRDERERVPVPVWLTLGGWEPQSVPLRDWAAQTITRDHPALRAAAYGPDAAGELLLGGRVALFLDGLDEMPRSLRVHALKRLDDEATGLRVIITTRPAEYRETALMATLSNAAVIELRPVRPRAAAAYLRYGQTGLSLERWEQVASYLERNPDSVPARTLNNPLTLSLARDSYSARDPSELMDTDRFRSVEEFRRYLIDQFVITAYPDEHERQHAVRWLAWLARQMGPTRDLPWWEIPAWTSRWQLHLARFALVTAIVGSVAAFATGHLIALAGAEAHGTATAVIAGLVVGSVVAIVADYAAALRRQPITLLPRFPGVQDLWWIILAALISSIVVGLAVAAAMSLAAEAVTGAGDRATRGFVVGLVVGGAFGLVMGLAVGLGALWVIPIASSPSAGAASSYRVDLRSCIVSGLLTGLAGGLAAGLGAGLKFGPVFGLEAAIAFGLGSGLTILLLASRAPSVKITELLLMLQGKGRVRFMHLLEQAVSRQVLRQAGTVYQFRHAELQDLLNVTSINQPDKIAGVLQPSATKACTQTDGT